DVYCEKPLTLTVDEGKQIAKVVKETKRVVQVGSWQRSDSRFRLAVELARSGRLGKIQKLSVALNLNKTGGPFPITEPPKSLNWDRWLGPAPLVPYIAERTHNTFRWWYEYAGGQVTDWGAHHIDIAQWILGHENTSPVKIETKGEFAAASDRSFNVPKSYFLRYIYHDGTVIEVIEEGRAGIMIEGDRGRIFVNRGTVSGAPIEQLAKTPFPREQFKLYARDNLTRPERAGKLDAIINHMGNFYDCLQSRELPISDIHTQHRTATTCHLANISLRLGRTLQWDPQAEKFVDDAEADSMLSRTPRKGYEFSA
ncbi:MAG: gfo/Idh/MocA family oxidoreductase, partial [Planctomycetota bacterium]|nr:gfo/Idh/MocA family oxidoreductase [Planctomycetota bacterium]